MGDTAPSLVAAGLIFEAKVTQSLGSGLERKLPVTEVIFEVLLVVKKSPSLFL